MENATAERAKKADIPAIMAIERTPGFENVIGRWSKEQHAAEMAKKGSRYFVLREHGEVTAFAIVQNLDNPDLRVHLKRIAASSPGRGSGTRLLEGVLLWLFTETEANGCGGDLVVENEHARRTYEKLGFEVEGRLRDYHRSVDGRIRDALIMSILRRDWVKRHRL